MWHYGILIHSPLTFVGDPLHLAFVDDVAYAFTNIQQLPQEEEEEEGGIPHIDTWRNTRVWVDNEEWFLNYEHPFPRVLDIRKWVVLWNVDISEFRVHIDRNQQLLEVKKRLPNMWHIHILSNGMNVLPLHREKESNNIMLEEESQ